MPTLVHTSTATSSTMSRYARASCYFTTKKFVSLSAKRNRRDSRLFLRAFPFARAKQNANWRLLAARRNGTSARQNAAEPPIRKPERQSRGAGAPSCAPDLCDARDRDRNGYPYFEAVESLLTARDVWRSSNSKNSK